ncbi:MAG: M13 family metallopeptidase [Flavobacteriales bacterium]
MKKTPIILAVCLVAGLSSCDQKAVSPELNKTEKKEKKAAFALSNLDKTVDPCTDFYQYAVGSWLKNNPIPKTESRWGAFENLSEENRVKINTLIEDVVADKNAKQGSDKQLVGDFYQSAMDTQTIETLGMKPIVGYLDQIDKINNKEELFNYMLEAYEKGIGATFGFWIGADSKDSDKNALQVSQGGFGLPDRDYYLSEDPKMAEIRLAYLLHLEKMFQLIGHDKTQAKASAVSVFEFEKALSEVSMTRLDRRDPIKTYNAMTIEELSNAAPGFKWAAFFQAFDIKNPEKIIVGQPDYMKGMAKVFQNTSLSDWKTFLKWEVVNSMAGYLSNDFVNQNFDFYSRTMNGVQSMRPRWKKAQGMLSGNFGETLGKLYVNRHFSEESKQNVSLLIENLRDAFRVRIHALDWMSDETKKQALVKLESFTYKIGYPDKWEDFSSIKIKNNTLVDNILAVRAFNFKKMLKDYGQPVDKSRWWMNPQTINAYYNPLYNEVVFPAAILQAPFYNSDADDAINYGGIGAVIGHEFTHGFDDKGCMYNAHGNLENWWTETDYSKFNEQGKRMIEQFNAYEALEGLHVNGALTLGENIADFGGLTMAYHAFEKSLEGKEKPADIDGFNYKQRVFLGWANVWKNNIKDEALRQRIANDTHSPGNFRVNGTLSNMPEFQAAWGCKDEDAMIRSGEDRVKIW